MTNEVVNVPELRFPEFNEKWDITIFGDVVTNKSSKYTPKKTEALTDIELDSIESNTGRLIKNYTSNDFSSQKNVFKQHQVLYSKLRPYLNKYYFPNFDGVCTSEIWILDSKYSSTLSNEFLYYFIQTNKFKEVTNKSSGSKMPRADWNLVENMRFNITSLKEQKKISDFFRKLDQQIELEEQKLEKLEEQKKGYMQQIFSHQLIFKDKNGATYPEWKTLKIKDIAEILRGLTYKPEDIRVAGIRVLRSSNIIKDKFHTYKDDIFVDESVVKIPLVNKGDILITAANGSPKLVGKHAIIEKLDDESVAGGFMYILRSDNSKFIQIWMSTMEYKRIISRVQGGNGSIGNLSRKDLENGYITLPCDEEQNKIGSFFNKFDELIEKQNQKIDGLKSRKKGFLQKMFV
ncbi:restriction endonuclease subunit S [Staphylococcus xylosus]|uniref:restriction endonuclease subunit S n=1 Tax=Staphylococcus xylosus TaxID=1288 RepID=UPI003F5566DF